VGRLGSRICRLADDGGGRGKCRKPCNKGDFPGGGNVRGKYVRGGNVQGECPPTLFRSPVFVGLFVSTKTITTSDAKRSE